MHSVIAAQLYTLRAFTKTPANIAQTLKKVKQIGYDAVQASALGPINPRELARILQGEGLVCCATHTSFERMRDQLNAVIDEHHAINCQYPAIGSLPSNYRSRDGYHAFARDCSDVARKLRAAGLTFAYHNHSFELEKFDGKTAMDILIDESDPQTVTFEIDTYWIQHGGGDPAAWIRKLKGRSPLVHLKDMAVGQDLTNPPHERYSGEPDPDYQKRLDAHHAARPIMAEVGEGNLNWPAILHACAEAGSIWYIVEQDTCQRDPFESLAISLRNLRAMGIQ
jgi:sugar phosphate isomerase/epimerase